MHVSGTAVASRRRTLLRNEVGTEGVLSGACDQSRVTPQCRWLSIVVVIVTLSVVVGTAAGISALPVVGDADTRRPDLAGPLTGPVENGIDGHEGTGFVEPISRGGIAAVQNNSSIQHRDPASYRQSGDLVGLQSWFGGELAGRLEESTLQLDRSQYKAAQAILGDRYNSYLSRYVDVARDTGRGDGGKFRETQQAQREFISNVQEYRETRDSYREARENGNDSRARRLARKLNQLQQQISRENRTIQRGYRELTNSTGVDLRASGQRVAATTRAITAEQGAINEQLFVRTVLRVDEPTARISFVDPLRVSGVLQTENGTAVTDQLATMQVGEWTVSTSLDDSGRFSFTVRPTLLRTGDHRLTVRYLPDAESVYLGSNESITVTVEQVTPELALAVDPNARAYGETVRVAGSVAVNGTAVPGVPIALTIGDQRVGTVRTSSSGSISAAIPLPAGVQAGERRVHARVDLANRAIGSSNASAPIVVERSETTLTVTGAPLQSPANTGSGQSVRVSGLLKTSSGRPVADQRVRLRIDGLAVAAVRTNRSGGYATLVRPPDGVNGSVVVGASFDGAGTNLESAEAQDRVVLLDNSQGSESRALVNRVVPGESIPEWLVFVAALVIAAVLGGGAFVIRTRGTDTDGTEGRMTEREGPVDTGGPSSGGLEVAKTELDGGRTDAAVEAVYLDVRRQLTDESGHGRSGRTHWEFVLDCETAGMADDRLTGLRELTAAYERAAFAAETLSLDEAEAAFEAGRTVLSDELV